MKRLKTVCMSLGIVNVILFIVLPRVCEAEFLTYIGVPLIIITVVLVSTYAKRTGKSSLLWGAASVFLPFITPISIVLLTPEKLSKKQESKK